MMPLQIYQSPFFLLCVISLRQKPPWAPRVRGSYVRSDMWGLVVALLSGGGEGKEDEGETGEREAPRGLDGEEWGNEKKRDTFTIAFNICHYGLNIPQCSSL